MLPGLDSLAARAGSRASAPLDAGTDGAGRSTDAVRTNDTGRTTDPVRPNDTASAATGTTDTAAATPNASGEGGTREGTEAIHAAAAFASLNTSDSVRALAASGTPDTLHALEQTATDSDAARIDTADGAPESLEANLEHEESDVFRWPALPGGRSIPWASWSRTALLVIAGLLALSAVVWAALAGRTLAERAWARITAPAPVASGTVVLNSVPDGAEVLVGGEPIGSTPLTTELPPGRHTITFRRGQSTRELELDVQAGRTVDGLVDWRIRPTGRLYVESTPSGAAVFVSGRERGATPLTLDDLPVGTHTLVLRSPSGTVERRVVIEEDKTTEVLEAIYSGFVHVSAPIELLVSLGGRQLRLNDRNQLLLPPGVHRLVFENRRFEFVQEREVEVRPGETTRIAVLPDPTTLTVTASTPSEVLLNGERIGETAIVDHPLALGTHEIVVRSLETGEERRATLTATTAPQLIEIDF